MLLVEISVILIIISVMCLIYSLAVEEAEFLRIFNVSHKVSFRISAVCGAAAFCLLFGQFILGLPRGAW